MGRGPIGLRGSASFRRQYRYRNQREGERPQDTVADRVHAPPLRHDDIAIVEAGEEPETPAQRRHSRKGGGYSGNARENSHVNSVQSYLARCEVLC